MNKTPFLASSTFSFRKSAPSRTISSPVVSTTWALFRTPMSCSTPARSLALVVLPVPGFPSRAKFDATGTRCCSERCFSAWFFAISCKAFSLTPFRPISFSSLSILADDVLSPGVF